MGPKQSGCDGEEEISSLRRTETWSTIRFNDWAIRAL